MAGQAEQIDGQGVEVELLVANHLHRIDVQQHTGRPAFAANGLQGLDCAHFALAPDQRHQPRWRHQQLLEQLLIHQPEPIHRQPFNLPAAALQLLCGSQGGRVFHR